MNEDERERAELMVARLRAERDARGGRLPRGMLAAACEQSNVSRASMYRYLRDGIPPRPQRKRWEWGPEERATLLNADGCVSRAREMLLAKGADPLPGVRQMQRAREQMPSALKVSLTDGEAAARQYELTAMVEIRERNELWLADHKQLDVMAMPPRGNVLRPWLTVIEDSATRRVLGASLSIRPNQGHVLAALGMALRAAGTPEAIAFDNGLEFLALAVTEAASELLFAAVAVEAWHPHHKGKIERLHRTLNAMALTGVPQRTGKPRDLRGRPRVVPEEPGIPFEQLSERFYAAVGRYNARRHSELEASPDEVFAEDPRPLRMIAEQHLRRFLLKGITRKIRKHGIRLKNRWYHAEEIHGRRSETVEVRYAPDDLRTIEVYRNGRHWCTAELINPADRATHERVMKGRTRDRRQRKADDRRAAREERGSYKAAVEPGPLEETTIVTTEDGRREQPGTPDIAIRTLRLDEEAQER